MRGVPTASLPLRRPGRHSRPQSEEEKAESARWHAELRYNLAHFDERVTKGRLDERQRVQTVAEQAAAEMRQKLAAVSGHAIEPWRPEDMIAVPVKIPDQTTADMKNALESKAAVGAALFRVACSALSSSHCPECPRGHALVKLQEGLRWYQGFVHGRMCDDCGEDIAKDAPRWRCDQNCDFDLCHLCYKKSIRQTILQHVACPSKVSLQAVLSVAAATEMRDTEEFHSAAQAVMQLYCEDIRRAAATYNAMKAKEAISDAMEALQGGVLSLKSELVSALSITLDETLDGIVEALKVAVIAADCRFICSLMTVERSATQIGLHTTTSGLSAMAASAMIAAHPRKAGLRSVLNATMSGTSNSVQSPVIGA
eukprot:gnl/TRDRNA2_/TRDRNA2_176311_c8_seq1.p1 gnl/TRDRNA2_/TRDRNA2_176311_c8~~gnl/TRDRNA2_/TRDRNA2_176311_c8_seq1.p1  ORF type:complete len:369 (-),score=45.38 gnl/TRDRNA2_/TRDRNA2_176311_c8_seq1:20-1126(-)